MVYSHPTVHGPGAVPGMGGHNKKHWILVPVSDQCEYLYVVLHFPFGLSTGPGPVRVQCEYTKNVQ